MKRMIPCALLLIALMVGCSTPAPKSEKKHAQPGPSSAAITDQASIEPDPSVQELEKTAGRDMAEMIQAPPAARNRAAKEEMRGDAVAAGSAVPAILPQPSAPGAAWNRESYNALQENGFVNAARKPLSTFSIDVDTASYANVRRFVNSGSLPPAGAVRIEEMINYFTYDYPEPQGKAPLSLSAEVGPSPFHRDYQLVRIGLDAPDLAGEELPPSNLVFLVDVSGSMEAANKLPLLKKALALVVRQLGERDRVAMVVYAGADRVVLRPTRGDRHQAILAALDQLRAGGSTHASSGIRTAYQLARQAFIDGGNNRVILASDGDFNVGVTSRDELMRLIEEERKSGIQLTVLGFGMGNYHDDTMEILADKGDGNYAYIDSLLEAKKVLVQQMSGTLFTLARDVKIQVEFNPARVGAHRLLGYENRALSDEDFRDDRKDAGEIGVGHRVTALYELIPAGHNSIPEMDPLKYQANPGGGNVASQELLTVKLRYKPKGADTSREMALPVAAAQERGNTADFRFAAAVAGYGMLLTGSEYLGTFTWEQCLNLARAGRGVDRDGYRAEFIRLVEASQLLAESRKQENVQTR